MCIRDRLKTLCWLCEAAEVSAYNDGYIEMDKVDEHFSAASYCQQLLFDSNVLAYFDFAQTTPTLGVQVGGNIISPTVTLNNRFSTGPPHVTDPKDTMRKNGARDTTTEDFHRWATELLKFYDTIVLIDAMHCNGDMHDGEGVCDAGYWVKHAVALTQNDLHWETFAVSEPLAELAEQARQAYLSLRKVFPMAARTILQAKGSAVVKEAVSVVLEGLPEPRACADEDAPQILEAMETLFECDSAGDAAALAFCHIWLRTVREAQRVQVATATQMPQLKICTEQWYIGELSSEVQRFLADTGFSKASELQDLSLIHI